jgi:hypothetical protein
VFKQPTILYVPENRLSVYTRSVLIYSKWLADDMAVRGGGGGEMSRLSER